MFEDWEREYDVFDLMHAREFGVVVGFAAGAVLASFCWLLYIFGG